jgi:hypothetical protein
MSHITGARVNRMMNQNGRRVAEVEIRTDDPQSPLLAAFVSRNAAGGYEVQSVYRKDADLTTDWYDNNEHQAYEELSNQLSGETDPSLEQLVLQALSFEDVKAELDSGL